MPGDFLPSASIEMLRRRAELLSRVRRFFEERSFFEVETPVLSHDTVIDRHLDPLAVTMFRDPRQHRLGPTLWLQTSPEFGMKRLLAAGASAIYQVTRAFRGGEVGPLHNPEFTMVEWYRSGDDYAAGMQLLADLAAELLEQGTPDRVTYRDAFQQHAGVDPLTASTEVLAAALQRLRKSEFELDSLAGLDRDALLDLLLTQCVEPNLGVDRPAIVYDYPASQSALAQIRPGNPPVAERFELYVCGIELANGYHELLDPAPLRERNRRNNQLRLADGKYALPDESRLLTAMTHGLPASAGCALGFDRLAMVAMGARTIQEVMAFPIDRA